MPDPEQSPAQAALAWLARRHSGRWSAADEQAHAAWLAADPAHRIEWHQAQALWSELGGLRAHAAAELRAARLARIARPGWGAGLALAGICALATGLLPALLPGGFDAPQVHQTARGEQRSLTLADGSTIDLNTSSRVEVDYGLRCRCVRLSAGEAVFKVAHGDLRAFEVRVDKSLIRDLGTEFWMRSEPGRIAVAVLEGEIEVVARAGAEPAHLSAGQNIAYDRSGRRLASAGVTLADLVAWRAGAIVFRDTPLPAALAEFARYHAFNIDMDPQLQGFHLSGRFAFADLDGLLKLIQSAYPVSVQRPAPDRLRVELRRARGA